jgi:hypothetical protein
MPIGGTAFFGQNQSPRITTNYLNQLNRHGDPAPGVPVSTAQVSGSIVQPYSGFEGGKLTITNPWAVQFADPQVGPLYGGVYMYVQLDPLATVPLERGAPVFWLNELQYVVTAAGTTGGTPNKIAGIALNSTSPGYWDFIQIMGIAMVMFTGTGSGVIGNLVEVDGSVTPPSVQPGTTLSENTIGTAVLAAPAAGAISPVELNLQAGYNF